MLVCILLIFLFYFLFCRRSSQASPICSSNSSPISEQPTPLNSSTPIFVTPDGTVYYSDDTPTLPTQQVQYPLLWNSELVSYNLTNYLSTTQRQFLTPDLYLSPSSILSRPSTSSSPSPSSTSSSVSTARASQIGHNHSHHSSYLYNTIRNRNLNKSYSPCHRVGYNSQLKFKTRRRTSASLRALHSLCLCSVSSRFSHTLDQHHRLKLDNLVNFDNTTSIRAQLFNTSGLSTMGQKVSASLNVKHHPSMMRESTTCTSTLTPLHLSSPSPTPIHDSALFPYSISTCKLEEPERPARLDLLLDLPPVSEDIQKLHGWNEKDRSLNIFVHDSDPRHVHRHPVAQSTDCVRGLVGYSKGLHVWEIKWPLRQRGTHAVVGVATTQASLHANGYHPLVGSTSESWGWDLGRNMLYHDLKSQNYTRSRDNYGQLYEHQFAMEPQFVAPESFLVVLDMDEGTLSFMANGQYLGVAFRGMSGKTLYPIVSSVWGHCEITMRYINGLNRK